MSTPSTLEAAGSRPSYVYVASSWRNEVQPILCSLLRGAGIDHYDFRNPPGGSGFSWKEVRPGFGTICEVCGQIRPDHDLTCANGIDEYRGVPGKGSDWEPVDRYLEMVSHPRAIEGYEADFAAMERADTFVLVLPCGKSAHLELGYAWGAGKRTAILLEDPVEPELMYRGVDFMARNKTDLLSFLGVRD